MAIAATEAPNSVASFVVLDGQSLSLDDVARVVRQGARVSLRDDAAVLGAMTSSLELNRQLMSARMPIYGVTTGFGDSVRHQISPEQAQRLPARMVRYRGNGTGPTTPLDATRAVMMIRANCLVRGHSAVRPELVQRLLDYRGGERR
jgi:histidine ammonia-lyase/phenylalanine ammonia-lyase